MQDDAIEKEPVQTEQGIPIGPSVYSRPTIEQSSANPAPDVSTGPCVYTQVESKASQDLARALNESPDA